VLNKQLVGP